MAYKTKAGQIINSRWDDAIALCAAADTFTAEALELLKKGIVESLGNKKSDTADKYGRLRLRGSHRDIDILIRKAGDAKLEPAFIDLLGKIKTGIAQDYNLAPDELVPEPLDGAAASTKPAAALWAQGFDGKYDETVRTTVGYDELFS